MNTQKLTIIHSRIINPWNHCHAPNPYTRILNCISQVECKLPEDKGVVLLQLLWVALPSHTHWWMDTFIFLQSRPELPKQRKRYFAIGWWLLSWDLRANHSVAGSASGRAQVTFQVLLKKMMLAVRYYFCVWDLLYIPLSLSLCKDWHILTI